MRGAHHLGPTGLEDHLRALCASRCQDDRKRATDAEADYLRLVNELMRLLLVVAEELFTFVRNAESLKPQAAAPPAQPCFLCRSSSWSIIRCFIAEPSTKRNTLRAWKNRPRPQPPSGHRNHK